MQRLLLLATALIIASAGARPPNLILIMADDFGFECVGANGGESYATPNLDRLAASGLRFEHCHVQPLCTPTRVQIMTGRYNVRNYLHFGVLPRTETTFGQLLQQAGYATGICGKWQLGRETDAPQHFGFVEACLWQHTRRPPRYTNPGLEFNGIEKDYHNGEYGPRLVNDWALDFIQRHHDKPFFLYYPMILTHDPFQPTPNSANWDPKAVGEQVKRNTKNFADMVAFMDQMIGRLDRHLEALGIRDQTLLLFLGDNGTHKSITSRFRSTDYQGGKGSTTRRGTHVPLIANWPSVIRQGRVCSDLISSTDFLPTLCAAAGVQAPQDIDGVSFLPQLRGEAGSPRDWLYTWYSPRQRRDLNVLECAFDHHFKLYRDGRFFDLRADPFEEQAPLTAPFTSEQTTAKTKLQTTLDRFTDARPAALDRQFETEMQGREPGKKKKKK